MGCDMSSDHQSIVQLSSFNFDTTSIISSSSRDVEDITDSQPLDDTLKPKYGSSSISVIPTTFLWGPSRLFLDGGQVLLKSTSSQALFPTDIPKLIGIGYQSPFLV
jgi:hypothetical protein